MTSDLEELILKLLENNSDENTVREGVARQSEIVNFLMNPANARVLLDRAPSDTRENLALALAALAAIPPQFHSDSDLRSDDRRFRTELNVVHAFEQTLLPGLSTITPLLARLKDAPGVQQQTQDDLLAEPGLREASEETRRLARWGITPLGLVQAIQAVEVSALRRIKRHKLDSARLLRPGKESPDRKDITASTAASAIAQTLIWSPEVSESVYEWILDAAACIPHLMANSITRAQEGGDIEIKPLAPSAILQGTDRFQKRWSYREKPPAVIGVIFQQSGARNSLQKAPVIVVVQLTGGNDYLNTVIPYNNPLYRDDRKAIGIPDNQIMHLDAQYGIPHYMAPLKQFWDDGKLAIMHGVGFKDSPRSHFRAMDIWHTCEPVKVGTEGWLGRVAREFDPKKENVVTTVSFGPSLPRSLAVPGVPVACVAGPLERYGFLPTIQGQQRRQVLDRFAAMYKPAIGSGPVMDYMADTGVDSLKGEDILRVAPQMYSSTVQYPNSPFARKLKGIAQVHTAEVGSRIFYCDHSTFDTHAGQNPGHGNLWTAVTEGIDAFMKDLREHNHADNVILLMFSEFGRRVRDNGSGTDDGAGGVAFVLGEKVTGGHYGEMPSLKPEHLVQGDLKPNMDFRCVYSTILDKWLGLNPAPIVNGTFERPAFLS